MKEVILIKNGELTLKGQNRRSFEDVLLENIHVRLKSLGTFSIKKAQSTMVITPEGSADVKEAVVALKTVFGIAGICPAAVCEKDMAVIEETAIVYLQDALSKAKTFKVEARRSIKSFPYNSPEICQKMGGVLLDAFPNLSVDVHDPDVRVYIEIRDFGAYIHMGNLPGAGGMPVGTAGRGALMLSGGIDSPVAGWMMAKRGLQIMGVHFESPPYTSERARMKVETLCQKLTPYTGPIGLYVVPFTHAQEEIRKNCKENYFTVIMRRVMCMVTEQLAQKRDCGAMITGESLGQVASQTMEAIACTDVSVPMPILRPLIGMDKIDIITIAKKIDTYETSILPYEDCCTVFTPKHPRTKPRLEDILFEESKIDIAALVSEAVENSLYEKINE